MCSLGRSERLQGAMRQDSGFTLIELLVVVAIIGILAAIAIPQFAEYKTRAFNSRAQSDLRNGLTSQEAFFVDNEQYRDCNSAAICQNDLPGFTASEGVDLEFNAQGPADSEFSGASCHSRGDRDFTWRSSGSNANVVQSASNGGTCAATAPII